ncbi:hypothetical protein EPA93_19040 [Ktedonosporobacter rubrisoli]|uniref:Uncharacterized protein n=1 Tax=Ktedonosporobacter rubrisoli TaxID=2509675 RepID=A0A4P6JRA2_KTERU|nr:hypothetical protein [Ktedonosporobacter rubrisoli]QBD77977.1 hypothetical protein EPA93_19040 [Ktedonosporobacter rubrisoli]
MILQEVLELFIKQQKRWIVSDGEKYWELVNTPNVLGAQLTRDVTVRKDGEQFLIFWGTEGVDSPHLKIYQDEEVSRMNMSSQNLQWSGELQSDLDKLNALRPQVLAAYDMNTWAMIEAIALGTLNAKAPQGQQVCFNAQKDLYELVPAHD